MKIRIEMPKGSKYKYEMKDGTLSLDRVLKECVPVNYGYIEDTLALDGDALDVFVASRSPLIPGSVVEVEVVGVYECLDQGVRDDKVLAILKGDYVNAEADAILLYLSTYKEGFEVMGYQGIHMADSLIERAKHAYSTSVV